MPPRACTPNTSSESLGAEHALQAVDAPQADEAAADADHERTGDADVAGGRRDRDETRDRAPTPAPSIDGLPFIIHSPNVRPSPRRRGEERVHEREDGRIARFERRTGVEAEPAHPQQ